MLAAVCSSCGRRRNNSAGGLYHGSPHARMVDLGLIVFIVGRRVCLREGEKLLRSSCKLHSDVHLPGIVFDECGSTSVV